MRADVIAPRVVQPRGWFTLSMFFLFVRRGSCGHRTAWSQAGLAPPPVQAPRGHPRIGLISACATGRWLVQRSWAQGLFRASSRSLSLLMSLNQLACIFVLLAPALVRGRTAVGGMSLQAEGPSVFAVVFSIARRLFSSRGRPNCVHQCFGDLSCR